MRVALVHDYLNQMGVSSTQIGVSDLNAARLAGFDVLVTTDQNLLHQQNLRGRKLAVFILGRGNWPEIQPHAEKIAAEINSIKQPGVHFFAIEPDNK